jgi:hypothetical protein
MTVLAAMILSLADAGAAVGVGAGRGVAARSGVAREAFSALGGTEVSNTRVERRPQRGHCLEESVPTLHTVQRYAGLGSLGLIFSSVLGVLFALILAEIRVKGERKARK